MMMKTRKIAILALVCLIMLASIVPQAQIAYAATDGTVQAIGQGLLNANRVNIRPAPSTSNRPLGKANRGDGFRVIGFAIPSGFPQGFFQVEGNGVPGSAFIAGNYLNVAFDAPLTGEITKKGYLYTAKSTSRRHRARSVAVGDALPLLAREGKWWRTEVDGQALWVSAANVLNVQGASATASPELLLTPSTTASTYGSVGITISGAEGASFVGWRRHNAGAAYTDKAGFTDITAAKQFAATANGWYAVGVVDAQGRFHYGLIQIANILSSSSGESWTPSSPTGYSLSVKNLSTQGTEYGSVSITAGSATGNAPGARVTAVATPAANHVFVGWVASDDRTASLLTDGTTYIIDIQQDTTLYAIFNGDGVNVPNEIATAAELQAIGRDAGTLSKKYVLLNNINVGNDWVPIGDGSSKSDATFFTGSFDGNGHRVTLLGVAGSIALGFWNRYFLGLFGVLGDGGSITNLTVEGTISVSASPDKNSTCGGIAGLVYGGSISDCVSHVAISAAGDADAYAGGVPGSYLVETFQIAIRPVQSMQVYVQTKHVRAEL